ncbi:MAG: hypothetical protein HY046_09060, partial [Acidobacteria bacterium]|nr:hypothetical protein [Acidobacteriota bacterium]
MGLESNCTVRWKKKSSAGKALLEEKEIVFRGDFRLKIPFAEIKSAEAKSGALRVKWSEGDAVFELGSAAAEKWALKIRYPRNRMDKLGIKPGLRVSVLGITEKLFWSEIEERGASYFDGKLLKNSDFIVEQVYDIGELRRLPTLKKHLQPAGAIWVVWPKGQPHIKEDHVRAAALA